MATSTACPQCGAERGHFYDCPAGGLQAMAPTPAAPPPDAPTEPDFARARRLGLPIALAAMMLLAFTPLRFVQTLFCAMWLHELGHATAAWLCGSFAVPLPWVTYGGHERSVVFIALELAALGAWFKFRPTHARVIAVIAALLVIGVLLPRRNAEVVMLFFGDGGALVFGTLLMLTVFLPDDARLSRGGLRWGFLVLGAAAFSAVFALWLSALRDHDEVPFGRIEGVGLSDPSRLVDTHGWTVPGLVHAYVALGVACLAVLAVAWVRSRRVLSPPS